VVLPDSLLRGDVPVTQVIRDGGPIALAWIAVAAAVGRNYPDYVVSV
jgi:hypothetical protein